MYIPKPKAGQYNSVWDNYYATVDEGDIHQLLVSQGKRICELYSSLTEEQSLFRYAEGRWSLKDVLGHIIDTERMMTYRILVAGRGDLTPMPRHADVYVSLTNFDRRPLSELIEEYRTVRASSASLVNGLTETEIQQFCILNEVKTSAAAGVYFILGHAQHHMNVVHERYLPRLT
ncbi:DinB family protein [Paenibacillus sp. CF384]|uniref:DinB family protein n=1 Tax=Paenibacillus sp. CF384 TaxID=1884382 RepID=UPI000898A916|nr:DinB family protein [Paenibacillus sp. CF384]SDW19059.1 DinB superfamily protein [Paenibacillus sp. CF384]